MWAEFKQRRLFWSMIIVLPVLSVLVAVLLLLLTSNNVPAVNEPVMTPTVTHTLVAMPAPNFELAQLDTNRTVRLSSLRGQVVFINFWATWCEPCRREFPAFQEYGTRGDQSGVILAVNVGDTPEKIEPFLTELGIRTVTVLLDADFSVSDAYDTDLFPSTFVVDPTGVVRAAHIGEITLADLDHYTAEYAS